MIKALCTVTVISVLLSCLVIFPVSSVEDTGYSVSGTEYTVTTATGLWTVAELTRSSANYASITIKLGNDIAVGWRDALTDRQWLPIGTETNPFRGVFDGQGYTVSGLYCDLTGSGGGLIAYGDGCTVKDLTIKNSSFSATTHVGGVIGKVVTSETTISNVSLVDTTVKTATADSATNKYVGGLVGQATSKLTISNVAVDVAVSGYEKVGGLVGEVTSTAITVTDSVFYGDVVGRNRHSGGLVGCLNGGTEASFDSCLMLGRFTVGSRTGQCGPVVGYDYQNNVSFSNCFVSAVNHGTAPVVAVKGGSGYTLTVDGSSTATTLLCLGRDALAQKVQAMSAETVTPYSFSKEACGFLFGSDQLYVQTRESDNAIRLIAPLNANDYGAAGMHISVTYKGTTKTLNDRNCSSLYRRIAVSQADRKIVKDAGTLNCEYLYCISVKDLPQDAPVQFEITTYVTTESGMTCETGVYAMEYNASAVSSSRPAGGILTVADVGQGNTEICVENTDSASWESYCASLVGRGYSLYGDVNRLNGNQYATYRHTDGRVIHTYFTEGNGMVRIICDPMTSRILPPDVTAPTVTKTTDSTITQMILDYYYWDGVDTEEINSRKDGNYGNCYILTLDDGSLMVYDGGGRWSDNDVTRLWNLIRELGTRNAQNKIEIAAWFITHEHTDHYFGMYEVLTLHGSEISLGTLYAQKTSALMACRSDGRSEFVDAAKMSEVYDAVGGFDLVRVHTGQKFWVRNAQIEVLYTPEDLYPDHIGEFTDFNDSSVVTRITVDGTSFMMLGDAYKNASDILCDLYGDTLKSDICQIAHHGWGGCSIELYDYVDPDFYMFPFSEKAFRAILDETGYIDWAIDRYGHFEEVLQHIVSEVGEDGVYRADHHNKTLVFATKEVIVRKTNNDQPGYPWGDKSQYK